MLRPGGHRGPRGDLCATQSGAHGREHELQPHPVSPRPCSQLLMARGGSSVLVGRGGAFVAGRCPSLPSRAFLCPVPEDPWTFLCPVPGDRWAFPLTLLLHTVAPPPWQVSALYPPFLQKVTPVAVAIIPSGPGDRSECAVPLNIQAARCE